MGGDQRGGVERRWRDDEDGRRRERVEGDGRGKKGG